MAGYQQRMDINQPMAGLAVRDVAAAEEWWTRLLGRSPDARPMDGLVEWHFPNGALQLVADTERAGGSLTTLQVSGLAADIDQLRGRGISIGDLSDTSAGAAFVTITDPDGNGVTIVDAT